MRPKIARRCPKLARDGSLPLVSGLARRSRVPHSDRRVRARRSVECQQLAESLVVGDVRRPTVRGSHGRVKGFVSVGEPTAGGSTTDARGHPHCSRSSTPRSSPNRKRPGSTSNSHASSTPREMIRKPATHHLDRRPLAARRLLGFRPVAGPATDQVEPQRLDERARPPRQLPGASAADMEADRVPCTKRAACAPGPACRSVVGSAQEALVNDVATAQRGRGRGGSNE